MGQRLGKWMEEKGAAESELEKGKEESGSPTGKIKESLNWIGVPREKPWWGRWLGWLGDEEMVVLWDYRGLKPDEVTVARGRIVLLRWEKYMPGRRWRWAWVRDLDSAKEGYIPRAYLAPHQETLVAPDTYSGQWYHGDEELGTVARALRAEGVPVGTFAVCNMTQPGDLKALDEFVLLVRLSEDGEVAVGEEGVQSRRSRRSVRPSPSALASNTQHSKLNDSNVATGSQLDGAELFSDQLIEAFQVKRDAHLRYFLNPGKPSPNLYSLVSRLKDRAMTVSVRLGWALPLRKGELSRHRPIPPPPAHPTRVPLNTGPNIDSMSLAEKRDLLRPFGIRSKHITQMERLGKGNFGTVHKGLWSRRKQGDTVEVALKKLVTKERDAETVFREEALIMAKLDHPNVIAFFGYDEARQSLVTELLEHGSLLELLKNSRDKADFSQHSLVDMVYQVACGMAHVEGQGLVHRDLSARNCLIGRGDEGRGKTIKVADFGLARPITEELLSPKPEAEVRAWRARGVDGYPWRALALESLAQKVFSPKTDVWALGILIQEVWTLGGLPYGLGNAFDGSAELFYQHLDKGGRVMPTPDMPRSILDLQTRTMLREPKLRPDFHQVQTYLHQILSRDKLCRDPDDVFTQRINSRADLHASVLSADEDFENV